MGNWDYFTPINRVMGPNLYLVGAHLACTWCSWTVKSSVGGDLHYIHWRPRTPSKFNEWNLTNDAFQKGVSLSLLGWFFRWTMFFDEFQGGSPPNVCSFCCFWLTLPGEEKTHLKWHEHPSDLPSIRNMSIYGLWLFKSFFVTWGSIPVIFLYLETLHFEKPSSKPMLHHHFLETWSDWYQTVFCTKWAPTSNK